jgi:hypothetical protein
MFEKPAIHRSPTNKISIKLSQQIGIVPMVCNNIEWSHPNMIKLPMPPSVFISCIPLYTKSFTLKSSYLVCLSKILFILSWCIYDLLNIYSLICWTWTNWFILLRASFGSTSFSCISLLTGNPNEIGKIVSVPYTI